MQTPAFDVPVRIDYACRGAGRIEVRRFDPRRDSYVALTALLHRAFASLGAAGLNCTCVDQTIAITRRRAASGDCRVAVSGHRLVGTLTLNAPYRDSPCDLYRHDDVARLQQFAIDPHWQHRGLGTLLLALADHWAATRGYAALALDTPLPAAHLIAFYRGHGFRIADTIHLEGKRYDSALMVRAPVAARTLAKWSGRVALPSSRVDASTLARAA